MIAVTGADGQLGQALVRRASGLGIGVLALGRAQLDVTDSARISQLLGAGRFEAVVNCAAYNAVDRAEDCPGEAFAVNAYAPWLLAQQGISVEVVKLAQVAPLELAPVLASLHKTGRLLAVEDVCAANCIGEQVLSAAGQAGMALKAARLLNLGNGIIPHGAPNVLKSAYGLDARAIAAAAQAMRSGEKEGNGV